MSIHFVIIVLTLMLWCYTVMIAYPVFSDLDSELPLKIKIFTPIGLLNLFMLVRLFATWGQLTLNDIVIVMFVLFMYQIILGAIFVLLLFESWFQKKRVTHPQDVYRIIVVLIIIAASLYFEYQACMALTRS